MGRHRADDATDGTRLDPDTGAHRGGTTRLRGVARWPLVIVTLAVLLVLGWAGWNWAESVATDAARAQAAGCPEGPATLHVVVSPQVEAPVAAAARSWNQAGHVVYAHCIHTTVRAIPAGEVLDALTGDSPAQAIGGLPAAWVPDSARWINELRAIEPALIGASGESIATAGGATYPYVGLSGQGVDPTQARAAQSFRAYLLREPQRAAFARAGLGPPAP